MQNEQNPFDRFDQLRLRAEALLKERSNVPSEEKPDILELIHELKVHQAELEIQNEELKRAQREISDLHHEFEDLYEFAPCGYITLNAKGIITRANLTAVSLLCAERGHLLRSGFTRFIAAGYENTFTAIRKKAGATGEKQSIELPLTGKDGSPSWVRADIEADRDETEAVMQWRMALTDITEKKKAEDSIERERRAKTALLEAIPDMMFRMDGDGVFLDYKADKSELQTRSIDTIIGKTIRDIAPPPTGFADLPEFVDLMDEKIRKALVSGEMQHFEYQLNIPPKDLRDFEARMVKICEDEVVSIVRNITERKRTETALKDSLAEKEALLREIHHRVKNNMLVILSLLRMHSRRTENASLTSILNDCSDRIQAMSLVHEALCRSRDFARIDFEAYLQNLCRNLGKAHDAAGKGISVLVESCNVSLNIDQGLAVGMVIAELISNAFRHAFPSGGGGHVSVGMTSPDSEAVRLIVADDGKGLPPEFDILNLRSLGLQLAAGVVTRELGGSIAAETDGGARFVIRFKRKN